MRCANGSLYTGITTDVKRRFEEHKNDKGRGAKYLKGKGPLKLEWQAQLEDKSSALKTEYRIKQLPKAEKEKLIRNKLLLTDVMGQK